MKRRIFIALLSATALACLVIAVGLSWPWYKRVAFIAIGLFCASLSIQLSRITENLGKFWEILYGFIMPISLISMLLFGTTLFRDFEWAVRVAVIESSDTRSRDISSVVKAVEWLGTFSSSRSNYSDFERGERAMLGITEGVYKRIEDALMTCLLKDRSPEVRLSALWALERIILQSGQRLRSNLLDSEKEIEGYDLTGERLRAIVQVILSRVGDEDEEVSIGALKTLGDISGNIESTNLLIEIGQAIKDKLEDKDLIVRAAAGYAIMKVTEELAVLKKLQRENPGLFKEK